MKHQNSGMLPYLYEPGCPVSLECFKVLPFRLKHDVPCHGFIISHPEMGKVVFITDSHFSPFRFPGISHWLIECNFDQDILDENILAGRIPAVVRKRVMQSHMSLQTCKELLIANDLSTARNVILLHLSNGNSDAKKFKSEIEGITGVPVWIADTGLTVELNEKPF